MAEDTTTDLVDVEGTGAGIHEGIAVDADGNALTYDDIQALPDQSNEESTDLADESNSTEQVRSESTSLDLDEDPNVTWAKKKGIDPNDPAALAKLAKIARDNQRDFTKDRQASSMDAAMAQLSYAAPAWQDAPVAPQYQAPQYDEYGQPTYQPQPPVANMQNNQMNLVMFRSSHALDIPAGSDLDQEIGKVISEDVSFWTSSPVHLERALKLAKANLAESSIDERIEQARREERDRLTRKSSLQSPANQSSSQSSGNSITTVAQAENFLNTASKAEIAENRDKLERILGVELGPTKARQ